MLLEAPLPHLLCVTKSLTLNSNDGLLCTIGICKIEIELSTLSLQDAAQYSLPHQEIRQTICYT